MDKELFVKLNKLKKKIDCSKNFRCIKGTCKNPSYAKYNAMTDFLGCLDNQSKSCEFSSPFGGINKCSCPLRKLIAKNFSELI